MKIAVLGTGTVGQQIGSKLVALGHEVMMGSRTAGGDKATAWAQQAGKGASEGTFAEAAAFGEQVWNCTAGGASLQALQAAGAQNLAGKILVDLSNPLDFSKGFPPTLSVCNDDSLGEQIQRAFPEAKVVKTLNTMANPIMVDPGFVPGDHEVIVSGNDAQAKAEVTRLLTEQFGWRSVIDLGDITTARGTEAWLLLWTRLYAALGNADFNLHLQRKPKEG
ncbi:NADPH-dependent F420 reductase [Paraliomyxa miuraensis]|uniref:NADPH-dependent F420 reductase n=1 Tax=Paraliomyxa miuraensis TaxID=376150 RepID=UPI0022515911|nr:NAD(P)-binding domain-containing protein [Paraliomyxa miuraensis]MCX4242388.1 NAD(P)-binding domain-containing protein [Paraliomyxa miuraensis]